MPYTRLILQNMYAIYSTSAHSTYIYIYFTGIQINCNTTRFIVGQTVNCICSSDLEPTLIEWYKGNQSSSPCLQSAIRNRRSHSGSSSLIITPTTDDHREIFKCKTTTPYGSQYTSIQMQIEGKNIMNVNSQSFEFIYST